MSNHHATWLFRICLPVLLLLLATPVAQAKDIERHQVIDGVSIYLGVLPIQMVKSEADELNLPSNVYSMTQRYYVLFAMFDQNSGKRIDDASVKVRVQALGGLDFSEKTLEKIHVEKLVSFGNYFRMADPDLYRISFWVTPAGTHKTVTGSFAYRRPVD